MKASSMLLAAGTLLVAVSAVFLVRVLLKPAPAPVAATVVKPAPAPPKRAVLVAAKPLTPGAFIDLGAVKWVETDQAYSELNYFLRGQDDEAEVLGATVRGAIEQGAAIPGNMLVKPGQPGFIAAVLQPGYRAISVPTSAVAANSGLVSTGDRVDVILSLNREQEAQSQSADAAIPRLASQTLLRNVRVLALNNEVNPNPVIRNDADEKDKNAARKTRYSHYDTVTLEVKPQAAEKLAVAKEVGTLQLVLRGNREPSTYPLNNGVDPVTTLAQTTDIYSSFSSPKAQANPPAVKMFRGNALEVNQFSQ